MIDDFLQDASPLTRAVLPEQGINTEQAVDTLQQAADTQGLLDIFHGYLPVFIAAFMVTLLVTPIMRALAISNNVFDLPDDSRKLHKSPVAYLGGAAVFLGLLAGIAVSLFGEKLNVLGNEPSTAFFSFHDTVRFQKTIPLSIIVGMTIIFLTGLLDDVIGISPRIKIAGQLFAAAALAMENVGVNVAKGVLSPVGKLLGNSDLIYYFDLPFTIPILGLDSITINIVYWTGTAIIAIGILGACNASNFVDGLDGLLSGITTIAMAGLLIIALMLAQGQDGLLKGGDGILDASRIVLCLAVAGACLGFLPHNFKPASIFLGDAGSQLLGYLTIVIIFTLGDTGRTDLVVAGLIIYAIPIIDTTLAIVRRKKAGLSISEGDHHHLHHMLKRSFGVIPAVFLLYGIGIIFAALGVIMSVGRGRVAYSFAFVLASFIGVIAVKIAALHAPAAQASDAAKHRAAANGTKAATPPSPVVTDPVL